MMTSFRVRLIFVSAFAVLLAGCSAESKKVRLLKRAAEYHKAGDYERARIAYQNVLQKHPEDLAAIVASAKAGLLKVKYDLLARAIPALSCAGAVDQIPILDVRNFNMEVAGRPGGNTGPWPPDGHSAENAGRWLHSDFRTVAFPYVQPMFQEMIRLGGLQ